MLQQVITNFLETNEKSENLSKELNVINKNQMQILELKYNTVEIKNSLDKLKHRVKMTEERISELEDRSIEFTQIEQQKENTLEKDKQSQRLVG